MRRYSLASVQQMEFRLKRGRPVAASCHQLHKL
jgi:hypothetical protein